MSYTLSSPLSTGSLSGVALEMRERDRARACMPVLILSSPGPEERDFLDDITTMDDWHMWYIREFNRYPGEADYERARYFIGPEKRQAPVAEGPQSQITEEHSLSHSTTCQDHDEERQWLENLQKLRKLIKYKRWSARMNHRCQQSRQYLYLKSRIEREKRTLLGHRDPDFKPPTSALRTSAAAQALANKYQEELDLIDLYKVRLKELLAIAQRAVERRRRTECRHRR
ncbi:hypothetical protein CPB84DRAFT_1754685 [Gymnopilus junonius]|uniref:Uncharacterized protein n=1 Tax=Gymnopilus junonius TaxID=109634 RepID=A0A9P5N8D8_GYMJU|nr:hypothetical protein CPB84DRAFT_1754685 [Gymnopilus junonius]